MTHTQVCIHTNDKAYSLQSADVQALPSISERTKPNMNALGGRIWDEETLYWKTSTHYQWLTDKQIESIIKLAFLEPSIFTPLKIQKKNRKMSDAQLTLDWLTKKDDKYFTSDSTLAYCYGPGSGLGGNCVMNADVLWLLRDMPLTAFEAKQKGYIENYADPNNKIKYYDPLHTTKHELGGHGLGMNHLTLQKYASTEIMYPFYNGLRKFGSADLDYLKSLYGSVHVHQIIYNTILSKIQRFI